MFPTTVLIPEGAEYNVSTLTTLAGALRIAPYPAVLITLWNPSETENVTLIVDPSTGGEVFDTGRRQQYTASPGEETHIELTNSQFGFIRISAQTDGPGYPTVTGVTFEVRALRRGQDPTG